ncbi:MAG TPA: glycosyl hydrolase family 18 protein [Actinocrinis sp.]|uniref:chitinase n=1 Tax=Actinocrinis sp. TaxID=1920516 RepID=UPI002DDDB187|nr:glycosyl hydrolase family 18 protein [Actinocrinis sp.]HEV2343772.1 glycosyl hydrolase family 18 protein [Actinocrinis sp.]
MAAVPFPGARPRRRALAAAGAAISVVLATIGVVAVTAGAQAAAANLVQNPGFESGSLSPWSCTSNSGAVVTSPVHSGSYALQGTPTSSDDSQCSQTISVQPSSSYTLSAWVDGSYVYIGDTGTGTTDTSTWTPGTSGAYSQLTTTFSTGASTTSLTVWVHGWYGQPVYYADDVSLTGPGGGSSASPSTAPSSASPSPSMSASPSPSASPTGGTGSCTAAAWVSTQAYNGGAVVSYNGHTWTAKWWTQGDIPGNNAQNVWTDNGACGGGNPSPSASPTSASPSASASPSPTGTGKHLLTGYWQDFSNGATVQRLTDVNSQYDIVAVAFANATTTPGQISFAVDSGLSTALGGYTDAQFKADIATMHSRGKKVIVSVGGQNGTISVSDSTSASNFASSAYSILKNYGFDGVDIDLENGVNATYMSQALHSLASMYGAGFVLTMAPQTIDMQSTGGDYFQLALNTKDILTIVNMQYYNSGSMLGCDGQVYSEGTENFLTALACIQLQGGLNASQVGLGVPASTSAAGGGFVSPSVVNAALDCLANGSNCGTFKPPATWPGIGGAMTWSTNWDASAGNQIATVIGPHLHAMP